MFQEGDKVNYWSDTLNQYVKMTVEKVFEDGRLQLSGKKQSKLDPNKCDIRVIQKRKSPRKSRPSDEGSQAVSLAFGDGGPASVLDGEEGEMPDMDEAAASPAPVLDKGGSEALPLASALGDSGTGGDSGKGGSEGMEVDEKAVNPGVAVNPWTDANPVKAHVKGATEFLRIVVEEATSNKMSVAQQLTEMFPPSSDLRLALLEKLPWQRELGYLTFQRQPSGNSKGRLHVAMLSYSEDSYPGKGVYLSDAIILLEQRR